MGLFLMRMVLGLALLERATAVLWNHSISNPTAMSLLLAVCGILFIIGLWTPFAGILVGIVEFSHVLAVPRGRSVSILLATIAVALAMLGPGLWSIDARLFGWKRIEPPPSKRSPHSV